MTKEELAVRLNGREYLEEITPEETQGANNSGLIVIFGSSDDCCSLTGAVNEDIILDNGGVFFLTKEGRINTVEDRKSVKIEALFADVDYEAGELEDAYTWKYKTKIPVAEFDILEDGEPYCRGIVIDMREIANLS